MSRRVAGLLALCLGVLAAIGALGATRLAGASCSPSTSGQCVRVLFLGNSYTYVNDLPAVFRDLAAAAGRSVDTGIVAGGGETLADHAASPESVGAIRGSRWQDVVLQEQSQIPAVASVRRSQMDPAARSLVGDIRATGATPVLLETWAHRDGWSDYGLDYAAMQAAIDEGYRALGAELGVTVAPAGAAWHTALRQDSMIALWQDDGSHPSGAGTYLAACVLFATIFGVSPVGNPEKEGLSPNAAYTLQVVAAQTVGVR